MPGASLLVASLSDSVQLFDQSRVKHSIIMVNVAPVGTINMRGLSKYCHQDSLRQTNHPVKAYLGASLHLRIRPIAIPAGGALWCHQVVL